MGGMNDFLQQLVTGNAGGAARGASAAHGEESGAAAAAGVLNAIDEDVEGGEEAPCPDEFEVSEDEEGADVE